MRQHKDFAYERGRGFQVAMCERVPYNLVNCGVRFVCTINSHSTDVFTSPEFLEFCEDLGVERIYRGDLDATPYFAEEFRKRELSDFFVVSPDKGSRGMGKTLADALDTNHIWIDKDRGFHHGDPSIKNISDIPKKDTAIIYDDMITTAGTVVTAIKRLKRYGVKRFFVGCVHALMVGDAEKRIKDEGVSKIISTDSIENKFSKISLAPLIVDLFKGQLA